MHAAANESVPDAGLINSAGRYVRGPSVPGSCINVAKDKRYRLRIVNTLGLLTVVLPSGVIAASLDLDLHRRHD